MTDDKKKSATVTLDTPLVRGEQSIEKVTLRTPTAGDLRGTTMTAVFQMDPVAIATVIPRISDPTINKEEYLRMDIADAAALGGEVVNFLLTRDQRAEVGLTT